jgi:lipopolysaccharide export LptBFGC system permease protein LptF
MRITLVDRYVARSFLASFVILLVVGIGLYVLVDLLVNMDEFTENKELSGTQIVANMADYYGYNLPLYYKQLAAPVMAAAAAFTLAVMLRNNELTAIICAGTPLTRVAVPILVCSVGLIALWVVNQEVIIPSVASKIVRQRDDVSESRAVGVYCVRDSHNAIITALRFYPREQKLYHVFIIDPDESGGPATLIESYTATYDAGRKTWLLEDGRRVLMADPAGPGDIATGIRYEPVEEYKLGLTPDELVLRQEAEFGELLSTMQLNRLVMSENLPNRSALVMARHVRLTQPLLQAILLVLSIPYFLTREPTSVLKSGGQAVVLGGLFFAAAFIAHSLVKDQSAALVTWLPILVFGPIASVRLANIKT